MLQYKIARASCISGLMARYMPQLIFWFLLRDRDNKFLKIATTPYTFSYKNLDFSEASIKKFQTLCCYKGIKVRTCISLRICRALHTDAYFLSWDH